MAPTGRKASAKSVSRRKPAAKSKRPGRTKRKKATTRKSPATRRQRPQKPKDICFVITPFGGWYDRYFDEVYSPAIAAAGLEARRVDDWYRPSAIVQDIWGLVRSCRVMLADLTGKNPNVFYELGLAHAVGKPVVLLTQDLGDVPFDLQSLRVLVYALEDPVWANDLRDGITQALSEVLTDPSEAVLAPFVTQPVEKQPRVSSQDKKYLELQRQISALGSQVEEVLVGESRRFRPSKVDIGPTVADRLIREYLDAGMPTSMIVRRVSELGPPPSWVRQRITKSRGRKK